MVMSKFITRANMQFNQKISTGDSALLATTNFAVDDDNENKNTTW
jgi:hypothetical protein